MSPHSVRVVPAAEQAILEQARFIAADIPDAAAAWVETIWDAIDDLARFPNRNAIAPIESDALGVEIRKLVFGSYLIFYAVDAKHRIVTVLRFRHGKRLPENREPGQSPGSEPRLLRHAVSRTNLTLKRVGRGSRASVCSIDSITR